MLTLDPSAPWQPACAAMHLGLWLARPEYLTSAVKQIRAGLWADARQRRAADEPREPSAVYAGDSLAYFRDPNGIAQMSIIGPMMKGDSKFGGVNSVRARQAIRLAARDPDVRGLFVRLDSPGGAAAGTMELADELAAFPKPTAVHVEDLGASAGYWVASAADLLTVNRAGSLGSIGVVCVLEDSSKRAEMDGVQVLVVSSGPMKGLGADGTPITPEYLAYVQGLVDSHAALFFAAISENRKLSGKRLEAVSDGRVFDAEASVKLGLADKIATADEAYADLIEAVTTRERDQKAKERAAKARLAVKRGR